MSGMRVRSFPAAARAFFRRARARLADRRRQGYGGPPKLYAKADAPWTRRRQASAAVECPREADVFEAIAFGRWGNRRDPELAAHVAGCAICRDLVEVACALHDDREAACREAHPPTAGMVWWRATIRARAEAAHTAMQPITVLQGIAGACIAGATAALATLAWRWVDATDHVGDLVSRLAIDRGALASASAFGFEHALVVLLGLAACLVLAPLALYITLADD